MKKCLNCGDWFGRTPFSVELSGIKQNVTTDQYCLECLTRKTFETTIKTVKKETRAA